MTARTLTTAGDQVLSLSIDRDQVGLLERSTRERLSARLGPEALQEAIGRMTNLAAEASRHIHSVPSAASQIEVLYHLGSEEVGDLSLPDDLSSEYAFIIRQLGRSTVNDLATLVQLPLWERFFATASDEDLLAFVERRLIGEDAERNWFLAETVDGIEFDS